jgi:hypothetical protein
MIKHRFGAIFTFVALLVCAFGSLFINPTPTNAQTDITLVGYGPTGPGSSPVINLLLSGTLDASSTGNPGGTLVAPVYDITAVLSGTIDGLTATLDTILQSSPGALTGPDAYGYEFDNQLSLNANGTLLDIYGLQFFLAGGTEANLFGSPGNPFTYLQGNQNPASTNITPVTLQATVTPEPGGVVLFGTGLLGIVLMMRKSFQEPANVAARF